MLVFDQPTRTGDVLLLACHGANPFAVQVLCQPPRRGMFGAVSGGPTCIL